MSKPTFNRLLQGVAVGLAIPTLAFGAAMTSNDYSAAKSRAEADYKAASARCDSMSGNPKDVCIAEAKAAEKKAKAEAEAQYKNTDKARADAIIAAAEADYDVAKARCDAKTGNDKDVCIKEAKAAEVKAKADAKANQKVAAARQDAREDKMDADYKVAHREVRFTVRPGEGQLRREREGEVSEVATVPYLSPPGDSLESAGPPSPGLPFGGCDASAIFLPGGDRHGASAVRPRLRSDQRWPMVLGGFVFQDRHAFGAASAARRSSMQRSGTCLDTARKRRTRSRK